MCYGNHKGNAAQYDRDEVQTLKNRIKRAVKKHGVAIEKDTRAAVRKWFLRVVSFFRPVHQSGILLSPERQ